MRALLFSRDDRDFDVLEAGGFEKLMELHFAETANWMISHPTL